MSWSSIHYVLDHFMRYVIDLLLFLLHCLYVYMPVLLMWRCIMSEVITCKLCIVSYGLDVMIHALGKHIISIDVIVWELTLLQGYNIQVMFVR